MARPDGWQDVLAKEIEAAAVKEREGLVRREEQRQQAQDRRDDAAEEVHAAATREMQRLDHEEQRKERFETSFDELLHAFEGAGGVRSAMESVVSALAQRNLAVELEVHMLPRAPNRAASWIAAIRIRSPIDRSAHGSVEIVASDDHGIKLLEIVRTGARPDVVEHVVSLNDLTEDRIGESVLSVVREMLAR